LLGKRDRLESGESLSEGGELYEFEPTAKRFMTPVLKTFYSSCKLTRESNPNAFWTTLAHDLR
jgi:hypothetical protein